jgi:hypothetical protein
MNHLLRIIRQLSPSCHYHYAELSHHLSIEEVKTLQRFSDPVYRLVLSLRTSDLLVKFANCFWGSM